MRGATRICSEHVTDLQVIARWLDQMLAPCPPHDIDDALGYAILTTFKAHSSIQAVREATEKETTDHATDASSPA